MPGWFSFGYNAEGAIIFYAEYAKTNGDNN